MNSIISRKIISIFLVFCFTLTGFSQIAISEKNTIESDINDNSLHQVEVDSLSNADEDDDQIISKNWEQLIGDLPGSYLENGFNNSHNINLRGKSIFTINNTEYLFMGTGNINKKQQVSKKVLFPIITAVAVFSKIFLKTSINYLSNLFVQHQKLLDLFFVSSIEGYFKNLSSDGCELWYFNEKIGWKQSVGNNSDALIQNGFNNPSNFELTMLTPFQSRNGTNFLYAGTWNPKNGCELWRTQDPIKGTWKPVIYDEGEGYRSSGFGNRNNTAAYSSAILGDWLYIGTMNFVNGCEIWRTDGQIWEQVVGGHSPISSLPNGFSNKNRFFDRNLYAWEMCAYKDSQSENLYVGTFNIAGCELWRTGNGITWECLVGDNGILKRGFTKVNMPVRILNYGIRRMEVYNHSLYIGTASTPSFHFRFIDINPRYIDHNTKMREMLSPGFEIYRFDGTSFLKVIGKKNGEQDDKDLGFNDRTNAYCWSMEEYNGRLYVGTMNPGVYMFNLTEAWENLIRCNISFEFTTDLCHFNSGGGCEIWYTDDGDTWYQLIGDEAEYSDQNCLGNGFDDKYNIGARVLITYNEKLYAGIMNGKHGCEVWSFNGESFPKKNPVIQKSITFESNGYTLYGEMYYPDTNKNFLPALVFCEGLPAYVSAYSWLAESLAEKGYVVIMFDPPGLGRSEGLFKLRNITFPRFNLFFRFGSYAETPYQYMLRHWTIAASDALNYLLNESELRDRIDTEKIGIIGHSLGGITATETAARDNRFKAVVALSHGNPFSTRRIDVPTQFISGGFDLGLMSIPLSFSCYRKACTPKEYVLIRFSNHIGFTTAFGPLNPSPYWQKEMIELYATGWFDYFLQGKPEAYDVITSRTIYVSKLGLSRYNFDGKDIPLT